MNGFKTLEELLSPTTSVNDFVTQALTYEEELQEIYKYGEAKGDECFIPTLDHQFRWRQGYVYCFTGYPGAGKSEFVNYLAVLQAKKMGKKVAMYSPENYPIPSLAVTLMKSYLGKNIAKGFSNQCTKEEFEKAYEFVNNHFFFLKYDDMPKLNELLANYQMLYEKEGIGMFITDPFNAVAEGASRDSSHLQMALTQMKMFAERNMVYNAIIEHPVKPQPNRDGSLPDCAPWHLYGGSMWWNKMDCIVTVARDLFYNSPTVEVRTWKMKLQRLNGKPGSTDIYFNVKTGQYDTEYQEQPAGAPEWARANLSGTEAAGDQPSEEPAPF